MLKFSAFSLQPSALPFQREAAFAEFGERDHGFLKFRVSGFRVYPVLGPHSVDPRFQRVEDGGVRVGGGIDAEAKANFDFAVLRPDWFIIPTVFLQVEPGDWFIPTVFLQVEPGDDGVHLVPFTRWRFSCSGFGGLRA